MSSKHDGVTCDACDQREFRLRRYKCLICFDYDLCGTCFDNHRETNRHSRSHPMQCLIPKGDRDIFYVGEPISEYSAESFTCPLCGQLGFTESSFSRHVFQKHLGQEDGEIEVLCPLCATHSDSDPNRQTRHLARHLMTAHQFSPPTDGDTIRPIESSPDEENGNSTDQGWSQRPNTRRIIPFLNSRPHRIQETPRTRASFINTRSARLQCLLDATTNQHSSYEAPLDLGSSLRSSTRLLSNSTVSRAANTTTGTTNRSSARIVLTPGQNSHNGGSGSPVLPASRPIQGTLTNSSAVLTDAGVTVGRISPVIPSPSGASMRDRAEHAKVTLLRGASTTNQASAEGSSDSTGLVLSDAVTTSVSCLPSGHNEANDKGESVRTSEPATDVTPQTAQCSLQGVSSQKSVCGDPTIKSVDSTKKQETAEQSSQPAHEASALIHASSPRDEFDEYWSTFISELAWTSLYTTQTGQSASLSN